MMSPPPPADPPDNGVASSDTVVAVTQPPSHDQAAVADGRARGVVSFDPPPDEHQTQLDSPDRIPSRREWDIVYTVVNSLAPIAPRGHVSWDEVKELLKDTYAGATWLGGTGILVPVLRDKIACDCAGLLAAWTLQDSSLARRTHFWEDAFRITIYSYLIPEFSNGGRPAQIALQAHADRCAHNLVDTYKRYGVVEGAALHNTLDETAPRDQHRDLPIAECDLRGVARTVSLALIAWAFVPGFEQEMRSLIKDELPPEGGWRPITDDSARDLKDGADHLARVCLLENLGARLARLPGSTRLISSR